MAFPFPAGIEMVFLIAAVVIFSSACGLCVALVGWAGRKAGIAISLMVLFAGLVALFFALKIAPRYWWLCLPSIFLGVQGYRAWKNEKRGRGIALSTVFLLIAVIAAMCSGMGMVAPL